MIDTPNPTGVQVGSRRLFLSGTVLARHDEEVVFRPFKNDDDFTLRLKVVFHDDETEESVELLFEGDKGAILQVHQRWSRMPKMALIRQDFAQSDDTTTLYIFSAVFEAIGARDNHVLKVDFSMYEMGNEEEADGSAG